MCLEASQATNLARETVQTFFDPELSFRKFCCVSLTKSLCNFINVKGKKGKVIPVTGRGSP
jgi:hypothetical protein